MSKNDILREAMALTANEKFIIVDELLKSLDKPDNKIDEIWEEEAVARLKAYDEGKLETVSEKEFFSYEN
jgi:putative addiction module component (TIGR02574 family)